MSTWIVFIRHTNTYIKTIRIAYKKKRQNLEFFFFCHSYFFRINLFIWLLRTTWNIVKSFLARFFPFNCTRLIYVNILWTFSRLLISLNSTNRCMRKVIGNENVFLHRGTTLHWRRKFANFKISENLIQTIKIKKIFEAFMKKIWKWFSSLHS